MLLYAALLSYVAIIFFFNDTATTEIYTLSLHDALPISKLTEARAKRAIGVYPSGSPKRAFYLLTLREGANLAQLLPSVSRSEEHTSELQSRQYLVCRLLLEKKKK